MSGAVILSAGMAQTGGGSGIVIPDALEWTDAYGGIVATTNLQTITGITAPVSIAAALSGGGGLQYILNGATKFYSGAFSASAGDTLGWSVLNVSTVSVSGTITITNASDGGATLDAPTYIATGSGP